jgi:ATP-dependent Clp protease ATP-binding subunit ClpB
LQWRLKDLVIGQDRAAGELVKAIQKYYVRMHPPGRPIANLLFLGPTGVGKTELVRALATALLGNPEAFLRVDCGEFTHSHEVAKLVGSPPGYLGHRETTGRLEQAELDKYSLKENKNPEGAILSVEKRPSILLWDEIEKAGESLFDILLGIMDAGRLTLGNNKTTDFTRTINIMTSNLGSKAVRTLLKGSDMGFHKGGQVQSDLDQKIYTVSKDAATKFFKPEFMNRLDRLIVFRSLSQDHLKQILHIELRKLKKRVNTIPRFIHDIKITPAAEDFILKEGTSEEYGARELKRAIERFVAEPISCLLATLQLITGDSLTIDHDGKDLVFTKTHDPIVYKSGLNVDDILTK